MCVSYPMLYCLVSSHIYLSKFHVCRNITEREFLELANIIDPDLYYDVGIHLGFRHAQLKNTIKKNQNNTKESYLETFMSWKDGHTGKTMRMNFAEGLKKAGLESLAERLLRERILPKGKCCRLCRSHSDAIHKLHFIHEQ